MTQPYNQIGVRYPWAGGECPVDGETLVRVCWGDNPNFSWHNDFSAADLEWDHCDLADLNIIAFEIVEFPKP